MKTRSSNIDLAKFFSALIIMTYHLYMLGGANYPFYKAWIYVEFFLIITGYFTVKHFDCENNSNPMKASVIYTIKKFICFLPYTVITTLLMYLFDLTTKLVSNGFSLKSFLDCFTNDFVFDILLITNSYHAPFLTPIWFLSALLICFPIFTWLLQILNRYVIMIFSITYTLLCFGFVYEGNTHGIQSIIRTICGLCLGVFLYEFVHVFNEYISRINKKLLTIIEISMFILPVILTYKNYTNYRFIVFCFAVCLAIMLSDLSYTSNIKCKLFIYLGRLSTPIFIIHWFIATVIRFYSDTYMLNTSIKVIIYYLGTLIVSCISMYFVDNWKWYKNIISKPIILKD